MKKLLFASSIIALFLSGCSIYPDADFSVNRTRVQPDEYVQFTNYSNNAIRYDWDFGDGTYSTDINPSHSYYNEGYYDVTLTVESRDGKIDRASIRIEVIFTELEIEVAEWNEYNTIEFIVDDCGVWVYDNFNDWLNDIDGSRAIISGTTGYDGKISFLGLDDRSYYIYVEKTDAYGYIIYDNYNIYQDFGLSYITTQRLVPYSYNYWLAWADYYGDKKISRVNQNADLKSITSTRKPRTHKNGESKIKIRTNTL